MVGCHIAAPDQIQVAVFELVGIQTARSSCNSLIAGVLRRTAEGTDQPGGSEAGKKGVAASALDIAHDAGVGAGKDRLRAALGYDGFPLICDLADRFFPGNWREATAALCAIALKRRQDALVGIDILLIVGGFPTDPVAGNRVVRVVFYFGDLAVHHFHQEAAGVGAVVRTD